MRVSQFSALAPMVVLMVVATPLAAQAARLSFMGTVQLNARDQAAPEANIATPNPVANAEVTVTFHGHEGGIEEYTTERTAQTVTDENGNFEVDVKLSEYRYRWTHVTVTVNPTDISKETTLTSVIYDNGQGGCDGSKVVRVMPL
ncbi:MAG: hypothetical protein ACFCVD_16540 [Nodosilinea sp.]